MSRRIHKKPTEELGICYACNGRNSKEHEMAI